MIATLAAKSLRSRAFTAGLTILSIGLSVLLLLGVERIRSESRESFAATVSGTDLVVGARTSPAHLLLAAVFHIGNTTNNVSWTAYRAIAARPDVAWTIPLALGDSHRGYRVLGTTPDFLAHYRFGRDRSLAIESGAPPAGENDALLGAEVARALHYRVGDAIVVSHGAGEVSFVEHDDHPFRIAGILARTGTPVDRTVHVPLEGLDAMHGSMTAGNDPLAAIIGRKAGPAPQPITAFLVGLKSRGAALSAQRAVNDYAGEPLTAVLPGVALQEVWEITGAVEKSLLAVSALVVVVGLSGMLVAVLTTLRERRREMAVLRSLGASAAQVFALILGEAAFLTAAGVLLGVAGLYVALIAGRVWLESHLGLYIEAAWPSAREWALMATVGLAGVLVGLFPAWRSYRLSLADGMMVRL